VQRNRSRLQIAIALCVTLALAACGSDPTTTAAVGSRAEAVADEARPSVEYPQEQLPGQEMLSIPDQSSGTVDLGLPDVEVTYTAGWSSPDELCLVVRSGDNGGSRCGEQILNETLETFFTAFPDGRTVVLALLPPSRGEDTISQLLPDGSTVPLREAVLPGQVRVAGVIAASSDVQFVASSPDGAETVRSASVG
jgi:hypothetical protein